MVATDKLSGIRFLRAVLPYSWVLTNVTTGISITQASDTFNNLFPAQYTLRMYDSCQNFVMTIDINNDPSVFQFTPFRWYTDKVGCDSTKTRIFFFSNKDSYPQN